VDESAARGPLESMLRDPLFQGTMTTLGTSIAAAQALIGLRLWAAKFPRNRFTKIFWWAGIPLLGTIVLAASIAGWLWLAIASAVILVLLHLLRQVEITRIEARLPDVILNESGVLMPPLPSGRHQ